MLAALLLAITCTPVPTCIVPEVLPCATPTPVIQGDHDRIATALYRIYAQRADDVIWPWHIDVTYRAADDEADEAAPFILLPWPVQRLIPTDVQREEIRIMVKAVTAGNVESAPSTILTICMPPLWSGTGAYE